VVGAWAWLSPTTTTTAKLDLFVTGFGGSALYHGLGNCKFRGVTEKAGIGGSGFMTGAAWVTTTGTLRRSFRLPLFSSRHEQSPQFGSNKFCRFKGILVQCGPWASKAKRFPLSQSRRRHLRGSLR